MRRYQQRIKHHFKRVLKIKTTPHEIALGFAIGTVIGVLPTPGISFLIAFFILTIFPKVSKIAMFAGIIFWNPFLTIPLYPLSYAIGDYLMGDTPPITLEFSGLYNMFNYSRRFLLGNSILAVTIALLSYFLIRSITAFYQKKKKSQQKTN